MSSSVRVALCAVGLVVLLAAAGAYASTAFHGRAAAARLTQGAVVSAVTSELGISGQELRADLASGQTLAQIAAANGKPVSDLEQAILGAVQDRLDQAVAAGTLSDTQRQSVLARVGSRLGKLVNLTHPVARLLVRARARVSLIRTAAAYLGLTPQQLRADLRAGQWFAQVAAANGKTVSGLEQAVEAAARARLDEAASAGKISAQQEQTLLSRLQSRLDKLAS